MDTLVMVMQMVFYPVLSVRWYLACRANREPDAYLFLAYASLGVVGLGGSVGAIMFILTHRGLALPAAATAALVLSPLICMVLYFYGMSLHVRNIAMRSGTDVIRTIDSLA